MVLELDDWPTGGRLQPVLMRPTPQLSFKLGGGGGVQPEVGGGVPPGGRGGGVFVPGVVGGSGRGSWGCPARGEGGGGRVRVKVHQAGGTSLGFITLFSV